MAALPPPPPPPPLAMDMRAGRYLTPKDRRSPELCLKEGAEKEVCNGEGDDARFSRSLPFKFASPLNVDEFSWHKWRAENDAAFSEIALEHVD